MTTTPKTHKTLQEIKNNYSVQSGVFAAVNPKITTKLNDFGQYEATADFDSFTTKELDDLAAVSAMSNSDLNESVLGDKLFGSTKDVKHNKVLGYYLDLYAGYVVTGDYRANASSGGLGTWLMTKLLEKGLIDGVINVIPADPKVDGVLFKYTIATTPDFIMAGAKSRYYPVDLSEVLRTVKKTGGRYAITGIPSFITELRLLAEFDPDFKKSIAYTIGLVCGHQKSTKYVEVLAWQHGIKPGDLISADFRKKVAGQPSSRYISEFTGLIDGKVGTIVKDQDELFASNWGQSMFKAKLSDFTDDAFNETSDISLGDAWLPEYTKDSGGTNVAIVRNMDIAKIIKEGLADGELKLDVLPEERIIKSQSGLVHHVQDELPYRLYKKDIQGEWRPKKRHEASSDLPFLRKKVQDYREKISTLSHIKYQEAVARGDFGYFERSLTPYVKRYNLVYRLINLKGKTPRVIVKKIIEKLKK